ncbi:hypothetical protein [Mesorhizobium sp. M0243]
MPATSFMRIVADVPGAEDSEPHPQHRIHPYLLRHLAVERPDQVWCPT